MLKTKEEIFVPNLKHGDCNTLFYKKWAGMKSRCGKTKYYINIKVCKRWEDYNLFKKDLYKSYLEHVKLYGEKNTTIDRVDGKEGYTPKNCRWATYEEQSNNRSNNKKVTVNNVSLNYAQAERELGFPEGTLNQRIKIKKWSEEKAVSKKLLKQSKPKIVSCLFCSKQVQKYNSDLLRNKHVFCSTVCRAKNRWDKNPMNYKNKI